MSKEETRSNRIVRDAEARKLFGDPSPATWHRWRKMGIVPQPIHLGPNSIAYVVAELESKIEELKLARDQKKKGRA